MNMRATRTVRIQLQPTPEQAKLLSQTMQEYTACFNEVCQIAETHKISNGLQLHRLTYAEHRATTLLPAHLICPALSKQTEAPKRSVATPKKQVSNHHHRLTDASKKRQPVNSLT